jgi:hypothetical protein
LSRLLLSDNGGGYLIGGTSSFMTFTASSRRQCQRSPEEQLQDTIGAIDEALKIANSGERSTTKQQRKLRRQ